MEMATSETKLEVELILKPDFINQAAALIAGHPIVRNKLNEEETDILHGYIQRMLTAFVQAMRPAAT
jgi:hypothetical protein